MALSFGESIKKTQMKSSVATAPTNLSTFSTDDVQPLVMEQEVVSFVRNNNYVWYNNYTDEKLSYIDEGKNISVDSSQINISQEENSQFIPFEMNRFYDGIDLKDMLIQIHYINQNNEEDFDNVVNCEYSKDKIRFAWLIDRGVTYLSGEVTFEIRATGTNEMGDNYCWISKPNGKLNILGSLSGKGVIKPAADWYTGFVNTMNSKINEAASYANQASASATRAEEAAKTIEVNIGDVTNTVNSNVMATVTEKLATYYNKTEVDNLISNIDVTNQLQDVYNKINNIDGLAKFKVEYTEATSTLSFYNGEEKIKDIVLNTNPTVKWTTAYNQTVDNKISNAVNPISEALNSYKESNDSAVSVLNKKIGNIPESLQTDYYKKTDVDNLLKEKALAADVANLTSSVNTMEQTVNTNKKNITTLSDKVAEFEDKLSGLNKNDTNKTYDATYEDSTYTLWEIEHLSAPWPLPAIRPA